MVRMPEPSYWQRLKAHPGLKPVAGYTVLLALAAGTVDGTRAQWVLVGLFSVVWATLLWTVTPVEGEDWP